MGILPRQHGGADQPRGGECGKRECMLLTSRTEKCPDAGCGFFSQSVQTFGRKKTAVAVAYCKRGSGLIKLNGTSLRPLLLRLLPRPRHMLQRRRRSGSEAIRRVLARLQRPVSKVTGAAQHC